jgi:hypothetical protein
MLLFCCVSTHRSLTGWQWKVCLRRLGWHTGSVEELKQTKLVQGLLQLNDASAGVRYEYAIVLRSFGGCFGGGCIVDP